MARSAGRGVGEACIATMIAHVLYVTPFIADMSSAEVRRTFGQHTHTECAAIMFSCATGDEETSSEKSPTFQEEWKH